MKDFLELLIDFIIGSIQIVLLMIWICFLTAVTLFVAYNIGTFFIRLVTG